MNLFIERFASDFVALDFLRDIAAEKNKYQTNGVLSVKKARLVNDFQNEVEQQNALQDYKNYIEETLHVL